MAKSNCISVKLKERTIHRDGTPWRPTNKEFGLALSAIEPYFVDSTLAGRKHRSRKLLEVHIDLSNPRVLTPFSDDGIRNTLIEVLDEHFAGPHGLKNYVGVTAGGRRLSKQAMRLAKKRTKALPPPRSAWLLMGDSASLPNSTELLDYTLGVASDDPELRWTCSPHVEAGDLLFLYFVKPHKSILYIGRAFCSAFYNSESGVNSNTPVDRHQWWTHLGSVVEIDPISFAQLNSVVGGSLNLKGRSGKYLAPDKANALVRLAQVRSDPTGWASQYALVALAERTELPAPTAITLGGLREIPSSLLRLEAEVERYVVEPLMRLARVNGAPYVFHRQHRLGRSIADYAVLRNDALLCVVEVKLRLHLNADRDWSSCGDVVQARGYAEAGPCPFVLIDCETIACFSVNHKGPDHVFDRHSLSRTDLEVISRYFKGNRG